MDKLKIAVIEGTIRANRKSIHVANLVFDLLSNNEEVEPILVDPLDFTFPNNGESTEGKDPRYSKIVKEVDGFFIVTPEYNHSFPGSLKRMLDSEYENYFYKPAAIAGVSSGRMGGVRAIEALIHVLRKLRIAPTSVDVHFPEVQNLFDDSGKLLDEKYIDRVERSIKELIWMAIVLKHGREKIART